MPIKVALIGNPNVGKSVIFNNLTGLKQHTGNWPGKTVEVKEGYFEFKDHEFEVIDLPGVYSLSAVSEDEQVAREFLIDHRPDVVVDILNAAQLERNLYLTLQLIELQVNLVLVLNMYDVVEKRGDTIDIPRLSELLGAPIVVTTATKKKGMEELKQAILDVVPDHTHRLEDGEDIPIEHLPGDINGRDHLHYHPRHHHHGEFEKLRPPSIKYSKDIEGKLKKIVSILEEDKSLIDRFPPRWLALKVFEGDEEVIRMIDNPEMINQIREGIL
ncbi:MAG: FeoB small GTPase domain-containing protein [Candidatus Thorarchaeota archaeon]|jgi:ferrous iron transport protein B